MNLIPCCILYSLQVSNLLSFYGWTIVPKFARIPKLLLWLSEYTDCES